MMQQSRGVSPYVSFSNYNGGSNNSNSNNGGGYKNFNQSPSDQISPQLIGGGGAPPPMSGNDVPPPEFQVANHVKPSQGIRPGGNPKNEYEMPYSQNVPFQYPQNVPQPQNGPPSSYQNVYGNNYGNNHANVQETPENIQEGPHRVREIESEKLYHLLTNHSYHFTPQNKPMKIFVKVYTDWCKPCRQISPRINELSMNPEFSDILFVQINGEKICDQLSKIIKVSAVPVFFGFVGGKKIDFIPGPDFEKIVSLCKYMSSM